jgi:hypothetical protein
MELTQTIIAMIPRVFFYLHCIKVEYSYNKFHNSIVSFYSQALKLRQFEYGLVIGHKSIYISSCLL